MSPALEDLIISLAKENISEDAIYLQISQRKDINETFTHADVYHVLAKYRAATAIAGHNTGSMIFTRIWGIIVFAIGLFFLAAVIASIAQGRFPSLTIIAFTAIMLIAGFILTFKPQNRFDKID